MRLACLLLLLAACGAPRALSEADRTPLRTAVRGDRPATWVIRGTYEDGAGEGGFTDRFAADGRFAREHRSAVPGGSGYDGTSHWQLPIDGLVRRAGGRTAREAEVSAAVLSGRWTELDLRSRGASEYEVAIDEILVGTLYLDASSGLPGRVAFHREGGKRELTLGDWRTPLGFPVAYDLELSNDGGRVAAWTVLEVTAEDTSFGPPEVPADHRFLTTRSEVPARRVGSRMAVMVRCEDSAPGFWLVDTGAGVSMVSSSLARGLRLPSLAEATLVGPSGRERQGLVRAERLRMGTFEVDDLPLVEADLSALAKLLGVPISGVLGSDVLARCVLDLDFAAGRAWVHDPDRWPRPEDATEVTLDGRVPVLEATFSPGHRGTLRLDTGSDDTVTFHGPTVRRLALTHRREDLLTVRIRGVGGDVLGDRGPHAWLEVGGQRFQHFPATYLRHSTGGLAREDLAGNLGAALFDRRRLVLALPHECIVVD